MDSQLSIRVTRETAQRIAAAAKRRGLRKSDVARQAISGFLDEEDRIGEVSPYESVKSLLGSVASGVDNLGERHREHLIERLKKHA